MKTVELTNLEIVYLKSFIKSAIKSNIKDAELFKGKPVEGYILKENERLAEIVKKLETAYNS